MKAAEQQLAFHEIDDGFLFKNSLLIHFLTFAFLHSGLKMKKLPKNNVCKSDSRITSPQKGFTPQAGAFVEAA